MFNKILEGTIEVAYDKKTKGKKRTEKIKTKMCPFRKESNEEGCG